MNQPASLWLRTAPTHTGPPTLPEPTRQLSFTCSQQLTTTWLAQTNISCKNISCEPLITQTGRDFKTQLSSDCLEAEPGLLCIKWLQLQTSHHSDAGYRVVVENTLRKMRTLPHRFLAMNILDLHLICKGKIFIWEIMFGSICSKFNKSNLYFSAALCTS